MNSDIEFNYNDQIFSPAAPAVLVELRSVNFPSSREPVKMIALVDSGAFMSLIPRAVIEGLHLQQVDEVEVGDYDAEEDEDFKVLPVYSVHLTFPSVEPILARVAPKKPRSHATIGRDVINEWLLTLNGPELKGVISVLDAKPTRS